MRTSVSTIIDSIRNKQQHLLLIGGCVNDTLVLGAKMPPAANIGALLESLPKTRFANVVRYDPFHGTAMVRNTAKLAGLLEEPAAAKNDISAELASILKQTGAAKGGPKASPPETLRRFGEILVADGLEPTLLILDFADTLFAAEPGRPPAAQLLRIPLAAWSFDERIHERGHVIAIIDARAHELAQTVIDRSACVGVIRIAKPDVSERRAYIEASGIENKTAEELARASSGLTLKEIGKFADECRAASAEAIDICYAAKRRALSEEYGDLLQIMQPTLGFEAVGGMEPLIAKLKKVAAAMREGRTALVPQGVLFMGPPGTGKTLVAEAFAKEAGVNFVKPLDIKSMWVGESERRMTRFLEALRDLSPIAVFIDEFDQNQSSRGGFDGDSGVSRTLFKKLLEIMSDTRERGQILWILATNRPDLIDAAMKRPGRCDLRIPFLPPDTARLAEICAKAPLQYPEIRTAIADWRPHAEACQGYNGADIIEVVRRAYERACDLGRDTADDTDMTWAIRDFRPQNADRAEIARMTLAAINECSSVALLPENWREIAGSAGGELGLSGTDAVAGTPPAPSPGGRRLRIS